MEAPAAAAYAAEIEAARAAGGARQFERALHHLERAHILGQRSTARHLQAHWLMLTVGVRQGDLRETLGQIPRMLAALLFSKVWVPVGNSGRARVSAFAPMPVPEDLHRFVSGR
jgi:hypothetical protein